MVNENKNPRLCFANELFDLFPPSPPPPPHFETYTPVRLNPADTDIWSFAQKNPFDACDLWNDDGCSPSSSCVITNWALIITLQFFFFALLQYFQPLQQVCVCVCLHKLFSIIQDVIVNFVPLKPIFTRENDRCFWIKQVTFIWLRLRFFKQRNRQTRIKQIAYTFV